MLGAIVGDIAGSRFEWDNIKTKKFHLFTSECRLTDDSVMSLAIAKAILQCEDMATLDREAICCMQQLGRKYPQAGYGGRFRRWLKEEDPRPYQSFGNGSAMRVSACGFAANSLEEAISLSRMVTEVTHNHPEGIKGAEAVAVAVFMAKSGHKKEAIRSYIDKKYYSMNFTLDQIRKDYEFDVSCQGSVPQALEAFFESTDFEDAIRNAISLGGDSDTIAAITGGIAEAYYGIPQHIRAQAITYFSADLLEILEEFEQRYPTKTEPEKHGTLFGKRFI